GHDLDLSEVHAVHVAVLQGDIAHELVQAIHGSAQQVLDGGLDLAVAHGLLIVAQLDPLRSRIPGSGQELTLGNRGIAHIRASLGFVVDHDAGGHAVIQDRAHLDHAGAEGALGIHVAQSLLQAVVAGVGVIHIIKLVALLVGQGQNHLHLGRHGEALGGVPVGVQGAVLEGQLLNSVGVGQQDGVEVLNGVLHVLDLVDELVSSLGEVDGLDLTDIAVSVILDLEPLALSHLTLVLGGVADPLQGVADLGDLHELAVDDHLAGPGPLGLIVVSLAVHVAAGDI
ncbi:Inner membrane ABC transporter permease protein ycjP, partial [Dysosmobacter welbionis]